MPPLHPISIRSHALSLALVPLLLADASGKTTLSKTDAGWTMETKGAPFYVKGFTWSHTPVGMKYDYDLFAEDESIIRAAIERDLTMMQAAGANTLRHVVPLKWMNHIHETYGMYFISNDYCGRYGMEVDGKFVAKTNYEDPRTREIIKQKWRELAEKYKSSPGLLAHALGNENNYGLEWKSAEAENLPAGEQQEAKARHLYSLFNEVALEVKAVDPDHPVGIVNGDLQYLDLIAELCPDIDFLAINAYRGETFSDMFDQVAEKLGKPVILMETGCDAYHAVDKREDQSSQAAMIHHNWIDLYRNTATNGGAGNCLGGVAFQWADEWWKRGQNYDLEIHDTQGSWHHGAYKHDAAADLNMNEEWFGVCSIRRESVNGAHLIQPRQAYYALQNLWKVDPYKLDPEELKNIKFDQTEVATKATAAAEALTEQLAKAEVPFRKSKPLDLPATVYAEADQPFHWPPSGVMPEVNFLALDPSATEKPHSGSTCLQLTYKSGGDWSGLVWQHPSGDWENNSPGGYDLTGASSLKLWARGEKGGETMSLSFGGALTGRYPNTCSKDLGELTLEPNWKEYTFSLDGLDLRRIKNPLTVVLRGRGFPYKVYLDDIVIE